MDLFDFSPDQDKQSHRKPLANRMRPRTLEEFIGQDHIVGEGRLLRRAIKADKLTPMIFFGPPGTGKTTLAQIIANTTSAHFQQLNAVTSGVGDIRHVISDAKERLKYDEQKTVLFIDEIHRFNKSQQDALLPSVEDGTIILIGATTESPMFEINPALLSRSRLFRFSPLTDDDVATMLTQALKDKERGYGSHPIKIDDDAIEHLVHVANGDGRTALHALELAVLTTDPDNSGAIHIDVTVAEESIQERVLQYDKTGDNHYDTVSAFIKSMRGSDPDATLFWLAKMITAGEDPKFIARRIYVHAAEDVGLADPNALLIAQSAAYAVDYIGFPEARIPLAEAALYIATAPKSNAVVTGIDQAMAAVKKEKTGQVPIHLRDAHYKGAKSLGHGKGYKYPHDFDDGYVPQSYLPDHLVSRQFYRPVERGYEKAIQKRLDYFIRRKKEEQ
ncbi:putative ATPase [Scopulibacillus darangshiensis]|uniref:Replication-associated recombination protein A n=1 Tax=Scopulibacillus darangshiensis TaxID=442528 RepID=A0A4V2SNS5_9BACL|nr:AAA family ATPase [Scopulibacillus darangshiensis]TCP32276.1 putative ATPase [Scopulibacillus darangshiensis]